MDMNFEIRAKWFSIIPCLNNPQVWHALMSKSVHKHHFILFVLEKLILLET
jgi:hypothetical protein